MVSYQRFIKAIYSKVIQKVRINGKLGEGFQTLYGVKQGDPLSLFGRMIEILDEMLQLACPGIGVKIGTKCIHVKYVIEDLCIVTSNTITFRESSTLLSLFARVLVIHLILVKQKFACSTKEEPIYQIFKFDISV